MKQLKNKRFFLFLVFLMYLQLLTGFFRLLLLDKNKVITNYKVLDIWRIKILRESIIALDRNYKKDPKDGQHFETEEEYKFCIYIYVRCSAYLSSMLIPNFMITCNVKAFDWSYIEGGLGPTYFGLVANLIYRRNYKHI